MPSKRPSARFQPETREKRRPARSVVASINLDEFSHGLLDFCTTRSLAGNRGVKVCDEAFKSICEPAPILESRYLAGTGKRADFILAERPYLSDPFARGLEPVALEPRFLIISGLYIVEARESIIIGVQVRIWAKLLCRVRRNNNPRTPSKFRLQLISLVQGRSEHHTPLMVQASKRDAAAHKAPEAYRVRENVVSHKLGQADDDRPGSN